MLGAHLTAWYWTPDGELRACVVTLLDGRVAGVIDAATFEPVTVDADDVLLERPE